MPLNDTWRLSSRSLLDFLFPPECPLCHDHPRDDGELNGLCCGCRESLVPRPLTLCRGCGAPLGPHLRPTSQCVHCHRDKFAFTRVWSLGQFEGNLRLAVLKAKAKQGELLTAALAGLLIELFRDEVTAESPDIVIGVPHHWTQRLRNKHHASETAAARIAALIDRPLASGIVIKQRRTRRQAALVPTDRRRNLVDAFRLRNGQRIKGKRILLVDDVLTSGTTAHRIASMLMRQGGAKDVRVCVLARGIGQT